MNLQYLVVWSSSNWLNIPSEGCGDEHLLILRVELSIHTHRRRMPATSGDQTCNLLITGQLITPGHHCTSLVRYLERLYIWGLLTSGEIP